ncbi:molybdenum cofactor synthesis 3 [Phaffia rhodozyma]|uniref:Molybdenum cofactor synthesis 3 n=1 Tax=Phaffia rhodozyma TaxID=264483 RepID=A0A0F7SFQ1_PHARH|nr:molybdenum cofactor synthesis 3 [Phaffia rhodozyma]
MTTNTRTLEKVQAEIAGLQTRLEALRLEAEALSGPSGLTKKQTGLPLELIEYKRYGRQMILPGVGLSGQLKLKNASVLIIGAGGLGCPALQYLAAAGVGHIGLVDHDSVESSNLHRQILHSTSRVGWLKVDSAKAAVLANNPNIEITTYPTTFNPSNALALLEPYALVLDCTDRPQTRYLISDACVLAKKPLLSGAALGMNGQMAVYNNGPDSPCYRCVWPRVAGGEAKSATCDESGVLGAVTGVIGTMMALEGCKLILGLGESSSSPSSDPSKLLTFSALSSTPFRSFKLRNRQPHCRSCGDPSKGDRKEGKIGDLENEDYEAFCGGPDVDRDAEGMQYGSVGTGLKRTSVVELKAALQDKTRSLRLIDTRSPEEYSIVSVPGSINIPLKDFMAAPLVHIKSSSLPNGQAGSTPRSTRSIYLICRRGNDSQLAARALSDALTLSEASNPGGPGHADGQLEVLDVRGGTNAWGRMVSRRNEGESEEEGKDRVDWPEY